MQRGSGIEGARGGRRNLRFAALVVATVAFATALGCASGTEGVAQPEPDPEALALVARAQTIYEPLPQIEPVSNPTIALGRMLYYEPRLSKNHDVSCNSCHQLDRFGVDGEPTSPGHRGQRGDRNSPTVYNAFLHIAQFWDGRAADVEEQAKGPVLNPVEMASRSEEEVVAMLRSIPGYERAFAKAFPDVAEPVTYDHMAIAIGAFERQLVTPSRFDQFLAGDATALSAQERRGFETFLTVGCNSCHTGATLGGQLYRKVGFIFPYETDDPGREKVTGQVGDRHVFKVPSLRNVAETAPYFHDGSIETLEEAVRLMGYHQIGLQLDDGQVADLVVFLKSLTGRIDEGYIARPALPPNGPETPAPDPT